MNPRTNWFLVLVALGLGAYIAMTRGHRNPARELGAIRFIPPSSGDVTAIQVGKSNTSVSVERTGGSWRMRSPVDYPAQATSVESVLSAIEKLSPQSYLPASTWNRQPDAKRQMGLENPGSLTVETRKGTWILRLGGLAPLGNGFYFQQVGDDGVFVADNSFLAALPASASDWRDHSLVDIRHLAFDHLEIVGRAQLEAVREGNSRWKLVRPLEARANNDQFQQILELLQRTEVDDFVSDSPAVPLDDFGLQPPAAQLIFKLGTNEVSRLQFGRAPTNSPGSVFVRRSANNNIVTVSAEAANLLAQPLSTFRDKRLLPPIDAMARIQISAPDNTFSLERLGTNWFLGGTNRLPADNYSSTAFLRDLAGLRIEDFVDDIVGDSTRYGFDKVGRTYSVLGTNGPLVSLQLGIPYGTQNRVYSRRLDEPSVYGITIGSTVLLPQIPAQLRSWQFETTNVTKVTVEEKGQTRILERGPTGEWKADGAALGAANGPAIDEVMYRLSQLQTRRFPAPPEAQWSSLAIPKVDHHITIQLAGGMPFKTLRFDFGGRPNNVNQYALAQFDGGDRILIEFPYTFYMNEVRYSLSIGNAQLPKP